MESLFESNSSEVTVRTGTGCPKEFDWTEAKVQGNFLWI